MPEKTVVVGHITEIINETGLVEIEEPDGNDGWKTHTVPKSMIEGYVKMELGEHVAVEVRDYGKFAVGNARPLTKKEEQYLRQRFARADAEIQKTLEELEDFDEPL